MAEKLYITRRRKKYKFAMFDRLANCFQLEAWDFGQLADSHKLAGRKIVLEIGAGSGLFSVELAKLYPQKFFIAVDIKSDRLYSGAKLADHLGLKNIVFLRSEISHLNEIMPPASVSEIWLTFPDPYPKKSDAKHRLSGSSFLKLYRQVLKPTGLLHFKTDNQALFDWSVEQLAEQAWQLGPTSRDLQASTLPDQYKIMTSYERRFTAEGLPIFYLEARPPKD